MSAVGRSTPGSKPIEGRLSEEPSGPGGARCGSIYLRPRVEPDTFPRDIPRSFGRAAEGPALERRADANELPRDGQGRSIREGDVPSLRRGAGPAIPSISSAHECDRSAEFSSTVGAPFGFDVCAGDRSVVAEADGDDPAAGVRDRSEVFDNLGPLAVRLGIESLLELGVLRFALRKSGPFDRCARASRHGCTQR